MLVLNSCGPISDKSCEGSASYGAKMILYKTMFSSLNSFESATEIQIIIHSFLYLSGQGINFSHFQIQNGNNFFNLLEYSLNFVIVSHLKNNRA